MAARGYARGVPMGGNLGKRAVGETPVFMVLASRDPDGANLDRIQIVKGWVDGQGDLQERVYDVVCADNRAITSEGDCDSPVGNTVDEANATIGLARVALTQGSASDRFLAGVQNDLFDLGADLATPGELEGALRLADGRAATLEAQIDALSEQLGPLTSFVLPGGSEASRSEERRVGKECRSRWSPDH